ncbi:MAG: leucine--tRNA ligase [Bacillota bacterium]
MNDPFGYGEHVDEKWQRRWEETGLYSFDPQRVDDKLYVLSMFSYPSGARLHVGHWYNFGLTDSWARIKRMQGYEIFEPMGFDAFGLPAENYAIKTGIHPQESTWANIETMRTQLRAMGAMFDWDYEVVTCDPDYYRWTQWLFLELYRAGLAYRAEAPVNWCPGCQTVLANEQVVEGACERCDTAVVHRNMTQWFFRITAYADQLLEGLEELDWPERTKEMQRNWIGRSEGARIQFPLEDSRETIEVFTTRPDTLFGANYLVLAPENPLVERVTAEDRRVDVTQYVQRAARKSELERTSLEREKTGVFTGGYALHPLSGDRLPIWVADYVILSYGTGAVMAVPAHDERDYEFSTEHELPIPRVIRSADGSPDPLPYTEDGVLVNSGEFDGMDSASAREAITAALAERNLGEEAISYRLRDWLVSRQRYWGAPVPMIHCPDCGVVPVPDEDLPVELPHEVDYAPKGRAPLASASDFVNTTCPRCGGPAERDVDTLDTFVDSSWYFLRYPDNDNEERAFEPGWIDRMLPVDKYVGGIEHAVMHLLYARFITRVLYDLGHVSFEEPFSSLTHQGMILGPDGRRMSKSRGNVVSPDDYISDYGSDVFRLYLAFGFNYIEGGAWEDDGIRATARFIQRVNRWVARLSSGEISCQGEGDPEADEALEFVRHTAIARVSADAEEFHFNTCVARMMELTNALYRYESDLTASERDGELLRDCTETLLLLMAPFTPHFAEEMWERLGNEYSIFDVSWPRADPAKMVTEVLEIAVQVNGKLRSTVEVPADAGEEDIEMAAREDERVASYLEDGVKRVIVVPGRLINFVV